MASLQGLLGQGKECTAEFSEASQTFRSRLHELCKSTHELFVHRNRAFSEASVLFEDGGEYAAKEVATCEDSIRSLMFDFENQSQELKKSIDDLYGNQTNALAEFDNYKTAYNEALTDLSMREGLGKKFGAPRRKAQETIRSIVSRSLASEAEIDKILNVIEAIGNNVAIKESPVQHTEVDDPDLTNTADVVTSPRVAPMIEQFVNGSAGNKTDDNMTDAEKALFNSDAHASVQIDVALIKCLLCLRTKLYRRGIYLSALAPHALTSDLPHDKSLPASSVDDHIQDLYEPGPTDNLGLEKFDEAIDGMEELCKAQTLALYEEVGKTEQLGDDQCPERLRIWLKKTRENAEAYEKEARKKYRHQVSRFAKLVSHGPIENAFNSFAQRSIGLFRRKHKKLKAIFNKKIGAYDEVRSHHDEALRPELGSANYSDELYELTKAEQNRCDEAVALVKESRLMMLRNCSEVSDRFVKKLLHLGELFLCLLDGCILDRDLAVIEDEIEAKTKRRTLKSLRRIRAVKEAGGAIDDTFSEFGGPQEVDPETGLLPRKGPRGRRKLWDGLPSNQLSLLALGVEVGLTEDEDSDELPTDEQVAGMEIAELQAKISDYGKKPKGKKAGALRKELLKILEGLRDNAADLAQKKLEAREQERQEALARLRELSPSIDSLRTHHHSAVLKGRANAFGLMKQCFAEIVKESDTGMDHVISKEEKLRKVWEEQVKLVVDSSIN